MPVSTLLRHIEQDIQQPKARRLVSTLLIWVVIGLWIGAGAYIWHLQNRFKQDATAKSAIVAMMQASTTSPVVAYDHDGKFLMGNESAIEVLSETLGANYSTISEIEFCACVMESVDFEKYKDWITAVGKDAATVRVINIPIQLSCKGQIIRCHAIIHNVPVKASKPVRVYAVMPYSAQMVKPPQLPEVPVVPQQYNARNSTAPPPRMRNPKETIVSR